jgi:hypothetical protein
VIEINDKRRLFLLVDRYLENQIAAWVFCKEYLECYELLLGNTKFTQKEQAMFFELGSVISKFSDDEDEIKKQHPGFFYTKKELKQKIIETKQKFLDYWDSISIDFVKLALDSDRGSYSCKDSSSISMDILKNFLTSDVRCSAFLCPSSTWQNWIPDDEDSDAASGNITRLEKDGPYIYLEDLWPEPEEVPIRLTMLRSQLVHLLDEWRDKVCAKMPKEVIIMHENGEFWIETKD